MLELAITATSAGDAADAAGSARAAGAPAACAGCPGPGTAAAGWVGGKVLDTVPDMERSTHATERPRPSIVPTSRRPNIASGGFTGSLQSTPSSTQRGESAGRLKIFCPKQFFLPCLGTIPQ